MAGDMSMEALLREVSARTRELAAINAVAAATAETLDLDELLTRTLEQVLTVAEVDAAEAFVLDEASGELVARAHSGASREAFAEQQRFRVGEGLPGEAARTGEVIISRDLVNEPRLIRRNLVEHGFRSVICIPLLSQRRAIGAINAVSRDPNRPGPEDVHVLSAIGRFAGMAVERALTHERAQRLARQLEALNEASLTMAADLSLDSLLQRIVDLARDLAEARYAALGVAGADEQLERFLTSGISEEDRRRIGSLPRGHGLLGAILRGTEPIRVPDIHKDPRRFGFPPNHPPMTSFLGVPILRRGRNLGNLYLTDKIGAPAFTEEDERLVVTLAAHAAVAIENARLYGQTHQELMERMEELRAKNRQMAEISAKVLSAQEEERQRIARDLHDDTAQTLTSLLVHLRLVQRLEMPADVAARLEDIRDLTAQALEDVRRMALDLRPTLLDDLGLVAAVEAYLRDYGERWNLRWEFRAEGFDERRLSATVEVSIYRTVQEALANVAKHAKARRVRVYLEYGAGAVTGWVEDDGCGFEPEQARRVGHHGLGLFGMRERISLVDGALDIYSRTGEGTRVQFRVPVNDLEAEHE